MYTIKLMYVMANYHVTISAWRMMGLKRMPLPTKEKQLKFIAAIHQKPHLLRVLHLKKVETSKNESDVRDSELSRDDPNLEADGSKKDTTSSEREAVDIHSSNTSLATSSQSDSFEKAETSKK
mmetsp:Transcript_14020/g.20949  ORF Transcript_14020/g.20949 Transcript_14020/m.20949 type:complete len:123 (-) Transcript_14020:147-515(-)